MNALPSFANTHGNRSFMLSMSGSILNGGYSISDSNSSSRLSCDGGAPSNGGEATSGVRAGELTPACSADQVACVSYVIRTSRSDAVLLCLIPCCALFPRGAACLLAFALVPSACLSIYTRNSWIHRCGAHGSRSTTVIS